MIRVENLNVTAGEFRLRDASMVVPTGHYAVVMGRTGSGKTTLLETIAGLKPIDSGKIFLGDREVTNLRPAQRNLGYVPQDGALFHTMTVAQHLAFPLHIRKRSRAEIDGRVAELAKLLGLEKLLQRGVRGLSGGERQRVALGRALSYRPHTLLLDEPLSALDESTRDQMMQLLKRVQRETDVTVLHVTHNPDEAERLGDQRLRFEEGRLSTESTSPEREPAPDSAEDTPADRGEAH